VSGKLAAASLWGRKLGCKKTNSPSSLINRLVGPASETDVVLENQCCTVLLDGGSQVSTVSAQWCRDAGLEIHSLDEFTLSIEGAGGNSLPYLGYAEVSVEFPAGLATRSTRALFLVVPTTEYHQRVPGLIGTNILKEVLVEAERGDNLSKLDTAWQIALKTVMQHRKIEDKEGSIGDVTTTKAITIPPNGHSLVHGQ
jgi:hypothetical protein